MMKFNNIFSTCSMVILRGDEMEIIVPGTALDVLANPEHLVVAGANLLSVLTLTVGSSSCTTNTWIKLRTNRAFVRLLKFNPLGTGYFASVSGQFIDVYSLGMGSHVQRIASFQAQSRKVADFCWCPFDEKFMMSCAENDSVAFWDLRTDLSKPNAHLGLTFGAGQSKFAPHLNNYLLTTNGTDSRLWDIRHTSQPVVQFTAHSSRVLCLDWHPHHQEPNTFFTSANDNTLKLWNMTNQKSSPALISVVPFSAWRLVFSQEGEELAAVSLPPTNAVALYSNFGLENPRLLKGGIGRDALMDAAWHKSTTAQKSTTKFLYTLSGNHILRRHAIAYELSLRDEMATPITQSKTDEERDRLVAAAEQQQTVDSELMQMAGGGSLDEALATEKVELQQQQQMVRHRIPTEARNSTSSCSMLLFGSLKQNASMALAGGGTTPQSPIYSEWQHWIRARRPGLNLAGGDLLTELEALRKHTTEGLYTTEVNFTRAAIGFSYMHMNSGIGKTDNTRPTSIQLRKINFEMRFHREFIDNGLVFVEVVQKESPFTADKAALFLTLLQQECDEQCKIASDQTILCRVLQQLPRIIDMMKVFTPAMDVPSQSKTSSQSGSANEEQILATLAATEPLGPETGTLMNRSVSAAVPCSYIPSPFDHRIPAPRNCGARFNRSGNLVVFGPLGVTFPGHHPNIEGESNARGLVPRIVPSSSMKSRRPGVSRLVSTRSQQSEGKVHPRSLAEYCVFVNPCGPSSVNLRQTSTSSAPFQSSPPVNISGFKRPSSPWQQKTDHSSKLATHSVGADQPAEASQQQNSLSPPTTHQQQLCHNLAIGATEVAMMDSSKNRSSASRILGSSPGATSSSTVRSYSLQNVALSSIRNRGNSMSDGIASPQPTTSAAPMPTASSFAQHQTSMAEYGGVSAGPAAVMPEQSFNSVVTVYDTTAFLPISKPLARTYKLLGQSPLHICRHNFEQAAKQGRKDLMAVWRLLEQCVTGPATSDNVGKSAGQGQRFNNSSAFARLFRLDSAKIPLALKSTASLEVPWAIHPLGRQLINRLLEHFASKHDFQMAAVITCIVNDFGHRPRTKTTTEDGGAHASNIGWQDQQPQQQLATSGNISAAAALSTGVASASSANILARSFVADNFGCSRAKQSMTRMDRLSPAQEHISASPTPRSQHLLPEREFSSELLLDPALSIRFEELRKKYADILYRWRMYRKCAEVLKHCSEEDSTGTIKAISWCLFCGRRDCTKCARHRRPSIYCAICEQPCSGIVATCNFCSHGGHFLHIANWFDAHSHCPLGCGCECKF